MDNKKAKEKYQTSKWLIKRYKRSTYIAYFISGSIALITILLYFSNIIKSSIIEDYIQFVFILVYLIHKGITHQSRKKLSEFRNTLKNQIIKEELHENTNGWNYKIEGKMEHNFKINCLDLVPAYDKYESEDYIWGKTNKNQKFNFYEIDLKEKRKTKNKTYYVSIFKGHIVEVDHNLTLKNSINIKPNSKMLNLIADKKTRIKLESTEFEKQFDAYSNDQIEARKVLTPKFIDSINQLAEQDIHSIKITPTSMIIVSKRKYDYFNLGHFTKEINIIRYKKQIKADIKNIHNYFNIIN